MSLNNSKLTVIVIVCCLTIFFAHTTRKLNTESKELEKAALVWLGSSIGNDCLYENIEDREVVTCQILDSLGLSPLFGEEHLSFIEHWFRNDSLTLDYFHNSPYLPLSSSSASNKIFDIQFHHINDYLIAVYQVAFWVHGDSGIVKEKTVFKKSQNGLIVDERRVTIKN